MSGGKYAGKELAEGDENLHYGCLWWQILSSGTNSTGLFWVKKSLFPDMIYAAKTLFTIRHKLKKTKEMLIVIQGTYNAWRLVQFTIL